MTETEHITFKQILLQTRLTLSVATLLSYIYVVHEFCCEPCKCITCLLTDSTQHMTWLLNFTRNCEPQANEDGGGIISVSNVIFD